MSDEKPPQPVSPVASDPSPPATDLAPWTRVRSRATGETGAVVQRSRTSSDPRRPLYIVEFGGYRTLLFADEFEVSR